MATQNYIYNSSLIQLISGVAELIIPNTFGTLLIADVFNCSSFLSLTETVTKSGSDNIQYQMKVGNVLQYWNGSAWVSSDGSFLQSNSVSTINSNAASLISSPPETFQVQIVFSGSGTTTPMISNLVVNYSEIPSLIPVGGQCQVFCYLQDITGLDLNVEDNAPVLVAVNDAHFFNNDYLVPRFYKEAAFAPDSNGLLASLSLVQTESSGKSIRFMVNYQTSATPTRTESIRLLPAVIPVEDQINLADLTAVDTSQIL